MSEAKVDGQARPQDVVVSESLDAFTDYLLGLIIEHYEARGDHYLANAIKKYR